jgi:hypothetical protein
MKRFISYLTALALIAFIGYHFVSSVSLFRSLLQFSP